jgi:hypothetical protein
MTSKEFSLLFHRAQVNLVAFRKLYEPIAQEAMQRMVEMAIEEDRKKRQWVGLTDEERYLNDAKSDEEIEYAKAIEAKLKEKNT